MKRWPVVGVTLAALWLFVRGVQLTPGRIVGEFLIGLGVGLPIAFAFRRWYRTEAPVGDYVRSTPDVIRYVALFLYELLTANLEVAYRVLSPSMPIDPQVFVVPLRVQTDTGITTIANSITLTPGTLTMDYDDEENALYVHSIAGSNRASVVDPIRRWEDIALRIFDEELEPEDPAPSTQQASSSAQSEAEGEATGSGDTGPAAPAEQDTAESDGAGTGADGQSGGETDGE